MNICFIDLELNLNQDEGNTEDSRTTDIIQLGAAILDTDTGIILDETFSEFVKLETPLDNGELRLSKFITTLTGIKDSDVNTSNNIVDVYNLFVNYVKKHKCSRILGEWGAGDVDELKWQVMNVSPITQWHFSKYDHTGTFDVKKMYQSYMIINEKKWQGGLRKAMNTLGLQLPKNTSYHNATTDAIATAMVYNKLVNKWKE